MSLKIICFLIFKDIRLGRFDDRRKFLNFKANYVRVAHHNYLYTQNKTDFLTRVNEISLMSHDEYASTMLGSFGDLNAYLSRVANRTNNDNGEETLERERNAFDNATITQQQHSLGQSGGVDWVSRGKVSYVKNQLTCGSCWSFAAVCCFLKFKFFDYAMLM